MSSSNILDFAYDSMNKTLTVSFLGGGKHQYFDVDFKKYSEMLVAKSKGKFFNENILDKHESKKIY